MDNENVTLGEILLQCLINHQEEAVRISRERHAKVVMELEKLRTDMHILKHKAKRR